MARSFENIAKVNIATEAVFMVVDRLSDGNSDCTI